MPSPRRDLEYVRELAKGRDGECLSPVYLGMNKKHHFKCEKGHEWKTMPSSVKKGYWCPTCAGRGKRRDIDFEYVLDLAKKKNGECISPVFLGISKNHRFRCDKGHEWETTAKSIEKGSWCSRCVRKGKHSKWTIEKVKQRAMEKGGLCLSSEYKDVHTPLLFKCGKCSHEWWSNFYHINKTSWCPRCSRNAPMNIEYVRSLARKNGGECLTDEYTGVDGKYTFRCDKGHEWVSTASSIKTYWCKE